MTDPRALRDAFGSFMTGITVVTTRDDSGTPHGFTANSFASVSLDPPLLLVCPGKNLSSYPVFASCNRFAISVLAEGQEHASNTFAGFKGDRFAQVPHSLDTAGIPVIDDAIAQFSCSTHQALDAGDHCILIGRINDFAHAPGRGLGYAGGQYFSLGLERGALTQTGRQIVCGAIIETQGHVLLEHTEHGHRPPQITPKGRAHLRRDLAAALGARGITARLGPVYSVFDEGSTHWSYILGTAQDLPDSPGLKAVPVQLLPTLTYTTPAIAEMMARYALEAQSRDFSLYLGDAQAGDTHSLTERS